MNDIDVLIELITTQDNPDVSGLLPYMLTEQAS